MNKLKKLKTEMRRILSIYYEDFFKGMDFDLGVLAATEKGIMLLKETYMHFILLRNTLINIKRSKKMKKDLSEKQVKMLNEMIVGTKIVSKQLLDILLPILEGMGE